MQLSVIILNYNVRYFLEQCVLSVEKAIQHLEAEIIVVDNHSSDDSCAMMRARFPHIKLIENKANLGFPKGNNIAVKEAKGEYICILNPDTVVAEDTFEKILNSQLATRNLAYWDANSSTVPGIFCPRANAVFRHLGWLLRRFLVCINFFQTQRCLTNITHNI